MTTLPPAGPRSLYLTAYAEGARCATAGVPARACPYGPDREFTRAAWLDGWVMRANKLGVDTPAYGITDETA